MSQLSYDLARLNSRTMERCIVKQCAEPHGRRKCSQDIEKDELYRRWQTVPEDGPTSHAGVTLFILRHENLRGKRLFHFWNVQ